RPHRTGGRVRRAGGAAGPPRVGDDHPEAGGERADVLVPEAMVAAGTAEEQERLASLAVDLAVHPDAGGQVEEGHGASLPAPAPPASDSSVREPAREHDRQVLAASPGGGAATERQLEDDRIGDVGEVGVGRVHDQGSRCRLAGRRVAYVHLIIVAALPQAEALDLAPAPDVLDDREMAERDLARAPAEVHEGDVLLAWIEGEVLVPAELAS